MKAGMVELQTRARRYALLLMWMVRDAGTNFRGAIVLVLVASFLGVLLQGGVLGIVLLYARHLESGAVLSMAGWTLDPRTSIAFLAVGGIASAILVLAAALIYLAKRGNAALSVNYEALCSRRVLEGYGIRPRERLRSRATRKILRSLLREQSSHARACGRALWTVMNGAYPLVVVLYMSLFLLVLNAETTLFLALGAAGFLYAHYRLNVQVVENEVWMRRLAPKFNFGLREVMNNLLPLGRLHRDVAARVAAAYQADHVRGMFERLRRRRVLTARADFLSNVMIGIATGTVVIYLGQLALSGVLSWGGVIGYLLALRITVSGVRSLLNSVAGYARWYPGVRAYRELTQVSPGSTLPAAGTKVRNRSGRGDLKELLLQPGDVAAILSPVELTRFTVFHFVEDLLSTHTDAGGTSVGAWDFVPIRPRLPEGVSVRRLLGGAGSWDELFAGCNDVAFQGALRALVADDADRILDAALAERLDAAQSVKLTLLAILRGDAQGVLIAAAALAQMSDVDQQLWLRACGEKILVVHHGKDVSGPGRLDEKGVIIGSRAGQIGLASPAWVQKRQQRILDRLCVVPREHRVGFDVESGDAVAGVAEGD